VSLKKGPWLVLEFFFYQALFLLTSILFAVHRKLIWLHNLDGVDLVKCFFAYYLSAEFESFVSYHTSSPNGWENFGVVRHLKKN